MKKKKILMFSFIGFLMHCVLLLTLSSNADHGKLFIWSSIYIFAFSILSLLLIFVFRKKEVGLIILLSLILPIILFIIIQILVVIAYWKQ